ncbi:MAG: vitamin K epoxide reductase family protein [Chloroflexi bacterium]|jgi:uncharacterized membrane protein|nr:vitamin K epoxide reductase family protein [Chloroflexota bacterium]MBT4002571.1 vitamin K epoxide reductase family protein [Chloroflexota bacterium]MBT4305901.1 vitamin K epoxide reductase family protein [Chloroflexota bacterium]MBT4533726.1 vitamin K epoxide reductase family protein [Chloroflexota bacterium]MBT4681631.1 vitamin K epoxide reductase family protein [Chloroflexota bacterium]
MNDKTLKNISIGLTIIGLLDSLYLSWLKLAKDEIICLGGCDIVNSSKYAEILGIPVALIGALAYLAILFFLINKIEFVFFKENSTIIVFIFSLIGVIYSLYLTYLELYIIHAICPFCVISAIVLVLLLVTTIFRLKLEFEE